MTAPEPSRPSAPDAEARERLSALLDGELDATTGEHTIDALMASEAARADWADWHVVGDALRAPELAADHRPGFEARLLLALAAEPVVLAPRALARRPGWLTRIVLPTTAVAAAAALLAVVALPLLREDAKSPAAEVATAAPAAPTAAPPAAGPVLRSPEVETYLTAHREFAGARGLSQPAPILRTAVEAPADNAR
ncbi:MAG: RseA family anti-sigma factor [Betaproteobacteria bacterium]